MVKVIYDVCIAGAGVSGLVSALKISNSKRPPKTIIIDVGRPAGKRRHQICGFLGCLPFSDGKFFISDIDKVSNVVHAKKVKKAVKYVKSILKQFSDCKTNKDNGPSSAILKKLLKNDYNITSNDYFQWYPKDIHTFSKYIINTLEKCYEMDFSFDNEILAITKHKNTFIIQTEEKEIHAKKVIFCIGRGGWRFAHQVFSNFGLVSNNDFARYGIRVEMPAQILRDFGSSTCTITKDDIEIGPFSWYGTVQPEDHVDTAISTFRSNESRWETDKVSFQFIKNVLMPGKGVDETNRIASLTYLLSNDRILKEKVSSLINGRSKILMIPEYSHIIQDIKDFATIIPEILTKAYFHTPAIIPTPSQIKINSDLSTKLKGFYVAGETANVVGLYGAAIMGAVAADSILQGE